MVEGIKFNPFTGKTFSAGEINKLDANQDGIITADELKSGLSWLGAADKDDDGEVVIDETAKNSPNNTYKSALENINDTMCENFSNSSENANNTTLQNYIQFTKNALESFLAQYKGDGTDVEAKYSEYLNNLVSERDKVIAETTNFVFEEFSRSLNLDDMIEAAGPYISNKELAGIQDKFSELALEALYTNSFDVLKSYDSAFASNEYFSEAKTLMDGLYTSATPSEDLAEIKNLLAKYAESFDANSIKAGYEADKQKQNQIITAATPNYQDSSLTEGLVHYGTNTTYGNDEIISYEFSVNSNGKPQLNNELDNIDYQKTMNELKTRLQEKYKTIMGDEYNEQRLAIYINQAMVNALEAISSNDQTVPGIKTQGGKISMTDIVNQTLYEMDKIAARSISSGSENKIDADAAIQSAGLDKTAENGAGNENEVKARLSGLKDAVLIQIKAKLGDKYDESAVKYLLDSAESTTMSLLKSKNLNSIQNSYIYNSFFSEFNKFYSQYIITNRLY